MTIVTVNDPIIAKSRGSIQQVQDYIAPHNPQRVEVVNVYLAALWVLCNAAGVDFLIAASQAIVETDYFTSSWWINRTNPAGIGITGDATQNNASPIFPNGGAAAKAQIAHLTLYATGSVSRGGLTPADDPRYSAYMAAYGATAIARTIGALSGNWAADATYGAQIAAHANDILAMPLKTPAPTTGGTPVNTFPSYAVAGLSTKIVLPVPLVQRLIPVGQTNQRPGITRQTPGYWVQHETANTNAGADADMHATYLLNGADGSQVSWHFTVDDHHIVQHIPIDEVTWQAADGSGPGNMSGVSCELCVNVDGDKGLIRRNGEALCGTICAALGLTVDQIKRHWDFNAADPNRHHCPDEMMNEGYWPQFVANAGVVITANQPGASTVPPTKPPKYATPAPLPPLSTKAFPFKATLTVIKPYTPRASESESAAATGADVPVTNPKTGKPNTVKVVTEVIAADGSVWFCTSGKSRHPASAFFPAA